MNTLPITKDEAEVLLAFMKQCETYFTYDNKWANAKLIGKLHAKLRQSLAQYEEISEDEPYEAVIKDVLDTISEMRDTGDYDENTLETLEWKLSKPTKENN